MTCACHLSPALHLCGSCGRQLDHADLVRTNGGFRCRVSCRPPSLVRAPARQVRQSVDHDATPSRRRHICLLCRRLQPDAVPLGLCPSCLALFAVTP
jgi:hypothetical protein